MSIRRKCRDPHRKKVRASIDVHGVVRVSQHLYGDAARGCHHRGNGPDACERTISHRHQCLGILIDEGPQRNPWGYRGGTCRRVVDYVSPAWNSRNRWNRSGPYQQEKEVSIMAAKKKAAKKPAAKKAAKKSSKKK